jgi:cytoskeletal protein CcmA (bactofilin family)
MKKSKKGIQTFLGPETILEGKLAFEGTVRLDGHFTGSIESKDGVMVIGEKAVVHAEILVNTAVVWGEVSGNIRATDRIELHQPARVFGDLSSPVVIIDAGVVFDGNCSMEPKEPKDDAASKPIDLAERQT